MNPFVTISPRADEELEKVLAYLENQFGVSTAADCLEEIEKVCWQVAAFPFTFPAYRGKSIRKAVISKHLSMFYQVRRDTIEILSFWDNRQNPNEVKI